MNYRTWTMALCWVLSPAIALADRPAGLSPQTITLPSGPASLKGLGESFSPDIATGSGSYSVPIQTAPGFLAPSLALSYSTGNGKSEVGLGFKLPVLHVYRTTDKGLPRFIDADRFAVSGPSLNDELVPVGADLRTYRLKNEGAFALFLRDPNSDTWTIQLKNGDRLFLGETAQARQSAPAGTHRWYLERAEDVFGHEAQYLYRNDAGHVYLKEVRYQLPPVSQRFLNKVVFDYQPRSDTSTDYRYGYPDVMALRLASIQVWHGARLLRTYTLGYEEMLLFSVLTSVQVTGENGLTLPVLRFAYNRPTSLSGQFVTMRNIPPLEGLDDGSAVLEDVNGDGLPDLLIGNPGRYRYYENLDGVRWSETAFELTGDPGRGLDEADVLLADMNGDGFRDVVEKTTNGDFRYYPGGLVERGMFAGYRSPVILRNHGSNDYHMGSDFVKLTDFNHDGRVDILRQVPNGVHQITNRETDDLYEALLPALPPDVVVTDPRVFMLDVNGDGVLDYLYKEIWPDRARIRVWYGLGFGRYTKEVELRYVPMGGFDEFFLEDVNRDGQIDLVRVSGTWVAYYLNDGKGNFTPMLGSYYNMPPTWRTKKLLFADMNGNGTTDVVWVSLDGKVQYLDLMGQPNVGLLERIDNGMGAVTRIEYRSSTEYQIKAKLHGTPWRSTQPVPIPLIARLVSTDSLDVLGFRATEGESLFEYREGYYDGREREFRGFGQVRVIATGDENEETRITDTYFHVGKNFATGVDEEILKGKPYLEEVKDGSERLIASTETEWEMRWLCQGDFPGETPKILPDCTIYPDRQRSKDKLVAFAVSKGVLKGSFEGTTEPRYVYTRTDQDVWGNPTEVFAYGEVTFAGGHAPGKPIDLAQMNVNAGTDELVTSTKYIYSMQNWLSGLPLGLPYEERKLGLGGEVLAWSQKFYDGSEAPGQATLGLVTKEASWLNTEGRWIATKRAEYDEHGHVVAAIDANGSRREVSWDNDETALFAVEERILVESGTLRVRATYDKGFGLVTSGTDLNGNLTKYHYDDLGRLTSVVDPLGTDKQPLIRYWYVDGSPEHPISTTTVETLVDRALGSYRKSYIYSDGLGRVREKKEEAEAPYGYIASGWQRLSRKGNVVEVTDPFPTSVLGFEAAPEGTPSTVSLLDALGRATRVLPPEVGYGATYSATQYLPFETRVYDEQDTYEGTWLYPAIQRVDGQGRVREIVKHNDYPGKIAEDLTWLINYDPLGRIVDITDPGGSVRTYQYDSLGRRTGLIDPHVNEVRYQYDDAGNLVLRTDALGQEQEFIYGLQSRLQARHVRRDAHGSPDRSYVYHYDAPSELLPEASNLLGRVSAIDWPHGSEALSYDEQGRLITELHELWDGRSNEAEQARDQFRKEYRYRADSLIVGQTLPGGLDLEIGYNRRALLENASYSIDGISSPLLGQALYDQRGSLKKADYGNRTTSCRWYDVRGRLSGFKTTLGETDPCASPDQPSQQAIQHFLYQYTPSSMIKSVTDRSPERPEVPRYDASYEYDRLYELVRAVNAQGEQTFQYDTIQNLVNVESKLPAGEWFTGELKYGERGAGPNQVTTAGGEEYEYDELGNMKAYNGFALEFDAEGRLVKAARSDGTSIRYVYDWAGERRLKLTERPGEPLSVTRYVTDDYEQRDSAETWLLKSGGATTELTRTDGVEIALDTLDQLVAYASDPEHAVKPLPEEYLDLDRNGGFDQGDVLVALQAFWAGEKAGGERLVSRVYHQDHLQSTTHVTDAKGDLVSNTQYVAYGSTLHQRGERAKLGFTGARSDPETELGLIRMGARWYAPRLGRWVSADPLFAESPEQQVRSPLEGNLYGYVKNSPLSNIDPSGNGAKDPCCADIDNFPRLSMPFKNIRKAMSSNSEGNNTISPRLESTNKALSTDTTQGSAPPAPSVQQAETSRPGMVNAKEDGIVISVRWENERDHSQGFGWRVHIRAIDGSTWTYGHLDPSSTPQRGQQVKKGQQIAYISDPPNGDSTGPHLHLEHRINGRAVDPGDVQEVVPGGIVTSTFNDPRRGKHPGVDIKVRK